jgi:hypothetical protein
MQQIADWLQNEFGADRKGMASSRLEMFYARMTWRARDGWPPRGLRLQ